MNEIYKKIRNNPNFLNLVRLRNRISWALTIIIISHKLENLKICDKVYKVDDKKLINVNI